MPEVTSTGGFVTYPAVPAPMHETKKLIELEALRGIAAIIVLVHHFMLGFTPRLHGLLYPDQPYSVFGTPAFAFVNGSAAVVIFFVLSGFVLTVGILRSQNIARMFVAAVKRWPRLALTVMLANAVAGFLMAHSAFDNTRAASAVPSIWLTWFYNWHSAGSNEEIVQSVVEGATTFFSATGKSKYNSNLWTMYFEFWGSMIAFGCAFLLVAKSNVFSQVLILVVAWLAATAINPYFGCFVIGVAISAIYVRRGADEWPAWSAVVIVPVMIFMLGYSENFTSGRAEGWYELFNPLALRNPLLVRVVLNSVGATLAILLFLRIFAVKRAMSGEVGRILGFMSFAIYLVQIPVICSISSWTYGILNGTPHALRILICLSVTLIATGVLAIPLAFVDRWWTGFLKLKFEKLR
jgi:peptidoglycan/LPS O-acetylase OafA/YrhL